MKSNRSLQRRGVMLHEAVIVTALSGMIVLLGIRLLHQAMTFAAESRTRIAFRQTGHRLANFFRDDIHDASTVSFEEDGVLRIGFSPKGSVEYRSIRPEKPMLERTWINRDGQVMREQFRLLDRSRVSFTKTASGDAVVFEIMTAIPDAEQIQRHELRVVAKINRMQKIGLASASETINEQGTE